MSGKRKPKIICDLCCWLITLLIFLGFMALCHILIPGIAFLLYLYGCTCVFKMLFVYTLKAVEKPGFYFGNIMCQTENMHAIWLSSLFKYLFHSQLSESIIGCYILYNLCDIKAYTLIRPYLLRKKIHTSINF